YSGSRITVASETQRRTPRRRRDVCLADAEHCRDNLSIGRGVSLDLLAEGRVVLFSLGARGLARALALQSSIIDPVVAQEGREDLRPVAASRPDLDDRRLRRDAKKGEFFERMARAVPRDEFFAALRIVDGRVERQFGGGRRRASPDRKAQDEQDDDAHPGACCGT